MKMRLAMVVWCTALVLLDWAHASGDDQNPDRLPVYPVRSNWLIQGTDLSPDGRNIATAVERTVGSGEETLENVEFLEELRIWDVATKKLSASKVLATRTVTTRAAGEERHLRYNGDGDMIVAYDGQLLHVLDAHTLGEVRGIDLGLPSPPRELHLADLGIAERKNLVAALISHGPGRGGSLRVYSLDAGELIREWHLREEVSRVAWHRDGRRLAITLLHAMPGRRHPWGRHNLLVLDVNSGDIVTRINTEYVTGPVCFAPDGTLLTAPLYGDEESYGSDSIKVWDSQTGRLLREIKNPPTGVHNELEISADGRTVLGYIKLDRYIPEDHAAELIYQKFRLWDPATGEVRFTSAEISPNTIAGPTFRLSRNGGLVLVHGYRHDTLMLFEVPHPQ